MASALLVTGPPGAGKTAVAAWLVNRFDRSALVAGDEFFGFLRRGAVEPWLVDAHHQNQVVTRAAAAATGALVSGGYAVVFDGIVGPWLLPEFIGAAGEMELQYVVLLPPVEECVRRVLGRTGHGFTDEAATRHMHAQFASAGLEERHLVDSSAGPVAAVGEEILRRRDGGLLDV